MAGIGPVREEKREGEVERVGSTRNGWESLAVVWSLGLVNHGGLERDFETRETEFEMRARGIEEIWFGFVGLIF